MSPSARFLLIFVAVLLALGVVAITSATLVYAGTIPRFSDPYFFLKRHLIWMALSLVALWICARIDYRRLARLRWPLVLLTVAALLLVFIPGLGASVNQEKHAHRWLGIGFITLQPSEMAKVTLPLFLSAFLAADPRRIQSFWRGFLPAFGMVLLMCGLIAGEPDVGTAFLIGVTMTILLVVAGTRLRHLIPAVLGVGTIGAVLLLSTMSHVSARLTTFLNPDLDPLGKGHQIKQSLVALGAGGVWGQGLGRGIQKLFYLPEVHSDFIFPVIGEELGFAGTAFVIAVLAFFAGASWQIVRRAPDLLGFLLALALSTYILIQAVIHIAVVTALVPTKGLPLPFVSFGGSSLFFAMLSVGLLVSIANAGERASLRPGGFEERERGTCASSLRAAVPEGTSFRD